jgi:ubiquinone/menaquinone biosynthesis C-methylase UbiE
MTKNREYYNAFAETYDHGRSVGYHKLIDEQATALVRRVGEGRDVLEVGCGTGLILERVAGFARRAVGIDLSPGMLARARDRGLEVHEADCAALPFDDESFDVVYSFKVLSHVPDLDRALAEMTRVLRPGGHLVYDLYNRRSIRYLLKRVFGPRATSKKFDEQAITTAFLTPREAEAQLPAGTRLVDTAGIRVTTVHPALLRVPGLRGPAQAIEWRLMDSPLKHFAGFYVLTARKG